MRTKSRRIVTAALAGMLAFGVAGLSPAQARHWHRGNAAVLGAVGAVFGTVAALAIADSYRDNYACYGCYAGYGGYYPGPYVYGYGPGYGYRHWHHHWHH